MTYLPAAAEIGGGSIPNQELGALLWEWNGTDLAQFDAVMADWNNDIGSTENAESAIVRSVVADPVIPVRGNVIQFAATAFQGHGVLLVKSSELALPERYVVVCRLVGPVSGATFPFIGPMLYFVDTGGTDADGYGITRGFGFSNVTGHAVVDDEISGSSSVGYSSGGTFNASVQARGGVLLTCTVHKRQSGATPAFSAVEIIDRPTQNSGPVLDTELPHTISRVTTGSKWDGLDMPRFGLWIGEGINGTTGIYQFGKFAVYAHPED